MPEDGKPTDEGNGTGKETPDDSKKPEEPDKSDEGISPLDRAETINKEKKELLEREEKLQDRKDKFLAEEKVGGRAKAGTPQTPEEQKEAAHQERVNKIGNAVGAQWAKPKPKE